MKNSSIFLLIISASVLFSLPALAYKKPDLARFQLTKQCHRCDLQAVNLNNKIFKLADLFGAALTAARLEWSNFQGANFEEAVMTAADFNNAYLEGVNFKRAKLQDVNFTAAHLVNANLEQSNLLGANMTDAILIGANLEGAIWIDGRMCGKGSVGSCLK